MSFYELTFIARQEISSSACDSLTDRLIALVEEQGGKLYKKEYWGLRALAYRVRKNRKGHYVHLGFDVDGQAVQELERRMRLDDDILRYLTLKVEAPDTEPSPMMTGRAEGRSEGDRSNDGSHSYKENLAEGVESSDASKVSDTDAPETTES